MNRTILTVLLLLFCAFNALSVTIVEKKYAIREGIGSNTINEIIKDENGFLWIATTGGITRFDGYHFVNYNSKNVKHFFESDEVSKLIKRGRFIYLLSTKEGLIKLDPNHPHFQRVFKQPMVDATFNRDVAAFYFDNGQLKIYNRDKLIKSAFFGNSFRGTMVMRRKSILLSRPNGAKNGLVELDLKTLKPIYFFQIKATHVESSCMLSKDKSTIIYSTGERIYRIAENNKLNYDPINEKIKNASFFTEDHTGKPLAILNRRTALFTLDNDSLISFRDDKNNTEFRSIFKLNNRTIFISSNQGLIKLIINTDQNTFINDNPLYEPGQLRVRRKIIEKTDGSIYLLGYLGMIKYSKNGITQLTKGPSPLFDATWHKGVLYVTTEGDGFFYFDEANKKLVRIMNKDLRVNDFSVNVTEINDSTLLLGRTGSILLFNPSSGHTKSINIEPKRSVYTVLKGKKQSEFYIGTSTSVERITISKSWHITRKAIYSTNRLKVRDLLLPNSTDLWVATERGIHILNPKTLQLKDKIYRPFEISNENVAALIQDKQGRIWASTFGGITIFNQDRKFSMFLTSSNNLKNEEYNFKSSALLTDGRIIFGGLSMYDILDPNKFGNTEFKKDFILSNVEKISQITKRVQVPFSKIKQEKINFNTGKEEVLVQLCNFDYTYSNDYRFDYRINTSGWNSIENKKAIRISNLPNGSHDLIIRMTDPYGKIVRTKRITVQANVPFYERKSFIIGLSLLAITLSILSAFYYRQFHRVEKETKSRIAMDLHDESGTILTRLLLISESMPNTVTQKESLKKGINEVLTSMRTFIESMSRPKSTLEDLYVDTEEFLSNTLRNTPIKYTFVKDQSNRLQIPGELYRDLKLCIFEAVNNCIRHSHCSHIDLSILQRKKTLLITIKDNGNLKELSTLKSGGNGIRNIRKRAKRNNGEVNLSIASDDHGLIVQLKFFIR